jgi:F0F1-type ATP synthase delta subunit
MKLLELDSLSFQEANKSIMDFVSSNQTLSDNELEQLFKVQNKLLVAEVLETYTKFDSAQLLHIENYINSSFDLEDRFFVSDLIDFAGSWSLNLNYERLLTFLSSKSEEENFVVLSTVNYILENVKYNYHIDIIEKCEAILDDSEYFQNVQISAALCLYRISNDSKYLIEIGDWFDDSEQNREYLTNVLDRNSKSFVASVKAVLRF